MPLLDHFRPPLKRQRHWDSFHTAWAEAMARQLNEGMLPENYFAEARVNLAGQVEIDLATFQEDGAAASTNHQNGGVAVWAPPHPTVTVPVDFSPPDLFEVQIINDEEGPRVVAAIELISPANKDRPSSRRMFAVKCANYLHQGIYVGVIDVVTGRHGNLHSVLTDLLQIRSLTKTFGEDDLYAVGYRTKGKPDDRQLDIWLNLLAIGQPLPTLPLWISPELCLPLDLEAAYQAACVARRIALPE